MAKFDNYLWGSDVGFDVCGVKENNLRVAAKLLSNALILNYTHFNL
ncbi:14783_t:CDS:2 [Rhizophagus irregularis]|nr:14783_t:CDS:2 [Rhizophagus irregularis]